MPEKLKFDIIALIFSELVRHLLEKIGPRLQLIASLAQRSMQDLLAADLRLSAEFCDENLIGARCHGHDVLLMSPPLVSF